MLYSNRATEKEHPMSAEALTALAEAGGTALVGAIATDAWKKVRNEMAGLFSRGSGQRKAAIEAQLESHAELVERANDSDRVRQLVAKVWQLELTRLLEEYPDVESELRHVIAQVQDSLVAEQEHWVQNNIASRGGVVYAVQDGKQTIQHYHVPNPVTLTAAGEGLGKRRDGV
jgi:hypothetical protein